MWVYIYIYPFCTKVQNQVGQNSKSYIRPTTYVANSLLGLLPKLHRQKGEEGTLFDITIINFYTLAMYICVMLLLLLLMSFLV